MPTLSFYSNKNLKNDVQISIVHYQPFLARGNYGTKNMTKMLIILEGEVATWFQMPCTVTCEQNVS